MLVVAFCLLAACLLLLAAAVVAAASCCCCYCFLLLLVLLLLPPPPAAAAAGANILPKKEINSLGRLVWRWREIRAGDTSRERLSLQKVEFMKSSSRSGC